MLVLSRKTREQIQIGENVVVTIVRVKGNTVRLGIEAPRDVRVVRSELPLRETSAAEANTEAGEGESPAAESSSADSEVQLADLDPGEADLVRWIAATQAL